MENMIVVPITKKIEIIMSIEVYLNSLMNINYKENDGKKSFSTKSKASISCTPISAYNKNNGDNYEYPSLSHLTNKL